MKYFFEVKNYIIKYKNIILFLFLFIMILISFGFTYYVYGKYSTIKNKVSEEKSLNLYEESKEEEIFEEIKYVYVDIKGYVKNPGVYKVEEDFRVNDVVILAGGLIKNANTKYLNLSKKVTDEMIINVYSNSEVNTMIENKKDINTLSAENENNQTVSKETKLININTADEEELMSLSGIGESKAKAIIEYRNANAFTTIDDIMKVTGISESTFSKIKTFITV